jgi:hypothetical protein
LKTFWGRRALLLCQIRLGAWRSDSLRLRFFRRVPVVGVPIAEVINTLVLWLRWMAGSYVGRLDTKMASSRSACLKYLGLAIPWYVYSSSNHVGRLRCVTFRGQCALVVLSAYSRHPGFYVGNEASLWGAHLVVPPSISGYLGAFCDLLKVGMYQVALPDSLHLCKIFGCLYTPFV